MRSFAAQLISMTLLEAARSRLAWVVAILLIGAVGAAQFLSQVAIVEAPEIQAALMGALLRLAGVFIVASFVVSSMVREANDRVAELLLAQPVPRWLYFGGKLGGFACVAVLIALACGLPLLLVAPALGVGAWCASFACELLLVAAASLFCVLSLGQVVPAFAATAALYVLARAMGTMQAIAAAPLSGPGGWIDSAVRFMVDAIALVVPALDRFSQTAWLTGAPPGGMVLGAIAAQTLVYLGLLAAAALFDLHRKNY